MLTGSAGLNLLRHLKLNYQLNIVLDIKHLLESEPLVHTSVPHMQAEKWIVKHTKSSAFDGLKFLCIEFIAFLDVNLGELKTQVQIFSEGLVYNGGEET